MAPAYKQVFDHLNHNAVHMNTWEQGFVSSLEEQFKKKGKLSVSQEKHLFRLSDRYNMDKIREAQEFAKNYGPEQRDIAYKCALYYDGQYLSYFHDIVTKVLDDPEGHVLTQGEFNKLCKNKYTIKILDSYNTPEQFAVGDMVQIRANNRIDIANTNIKKGHHPRGAFFSFKFADKTCMVLEVNAKPITRAAKGARVYKVLIIDETSPIYAHESDLKKIRRRKKK